MSSGGYLVDISVELVHESIDYPGDTPFVMNSIENLEYGDFFQLSAIEMSAHSGTHIDTPSHFVRGGKMIDDYSIEDFVLPALVVEVKQTDEVGLAEVENVNLRPGMALLFKTENSRSGISRSGVFTDKYVSLSLDVAQFCVDRGVRLVGLDYITIEPQGDDTYPVHKKLLSHDVLVLEGINLGRVDPGLYKLSCVPLNLGKCEASPVRAYLERMAES